MSIWNSDEAYGSIARHLHWVMAVLIAVLFGLGWWMVDLDYYSPYYTSAPDLHRSLGVVLAALLAFRIVWRWINVAPRDLSSSPLERRAARAVHLGFYPLLLAVVISGYLISTLDGSGFTIFGLVEAPSFWAAKGYEQSAGTAHWVLSYIVVGLAVGHAVAALKHHFVDGSQVLMRIWRGSDAAPRASISDRSERS